MMRGVYVLPSLATLGNVELSGLLDVSMTLDLSNTRSLAEALSGEFPRAAVVMPEGHDADKLRQILIDEERPPPGFAVEELPPDQIDSYIAGLIILAAAPCTAMVFVWSRLTGGHPLFTLSQVALNDTIMVFAFAPIVALLLGLSSITVPWATLLISVVLYIVIPVAIAQIWRKALLSRGQAALDAALEKIGPWSISALLLTLVLLFAFQGEAILKQPLVIALLAVPILIQVIFNAALAYWLNRRVGETHEVACPSALIGASNFFELAVAAAISLFGFESGAALATVVGVLIEVPVMLAVVKVVNRSKGWYAAGLKH